MTRHASRSALLVLTVLAVIAAMTVSPARWKVATPAHAAGAGDITLTVQSARSVGDVVEGQAITSYRWLISRDDVGDPNDSKNNCLPPRGRTPAAADGTDLGYTNRCQWPSARYTPGAISVLTQGNQDDFANGAALKNLPAGRYLISVTADGYKIDGAHFAVTDGATTAVTVAMQPYPLPLGSIRIRVFNDQAPVDGTYEVGSQEDSDCSRRPAPGTKCLRGFTAHISDVLGEVTTDYYGNPLCTKYQTVRRNGNDAVVFDDTGAPVIAAASTGCTSDANGDILIPYLGPDRYAATVIPPAGQARWFQTTTLEGGHDWDIWTQEGDTGYDTEQTVGQELQPAVQFGFVQARSMPRGGTGEIKGTGVVINTYVGGTGGVDVPNAGVAGASVRGPVPGLLVALSDLDNNDQMIYMNWANADGTFDLTGVPPGSYQLTLWDEPQDFIIDSFNVVVGAGQTVDVGDKGIVGWFTEIEGTIFVDSNANGVRDPGEDGVPRFPVTLRERDNSLMDQGVALVQTDSNGHYSLKESYPLSRWFVLEAFNTGFKTTGITIQADNEPKPRTFLGGAVDLDIMPVIGLKGRVDWGVQPYQGDNGGIAGTVSYDTTRNETDPQYAVSEDYQPGIPGVGVDLYAAQYDDAGDLVHNADGSVAVVEKGGQPLKLAETYTSETWHQPTGCTARMWNGAELTDQMALPKAGDDHELCVEAPMLGWYAEPSEKGADGFGQTVNGNYGFATTDYNLLTPDDPDDPTDPATGQPLGYLDKFSDHDMDPQPLPVGDYVVKVDIPTDDMGRKPLYTVTQEEDVNVFDGDAYLPQENFPPTAAEAASTPSGEQPTPTDGSGEPPSQGNGFPSPCAGARHIVNVTDQPFIDGGGSPFQGQDRPMCDAKLVTVRGNQTVAPNFNLFTPVPLPTHFWGLTINDLGLSNDKRQLGYGEAQPLPYVPMGIYDWAGTLVDTVQTDYNGMYEAIEPSTDTFNCPLPAGPCPNMYRFVGNDPGQPGHVNESYNPRFRTIATNFQAWPGLFTVTDTAPTQVAVTAIAPGGTQVNPVDCSPGPDQPQIFRIDKPVLASNATGTGRRVTLTGRGFGTASGTVLLSNVVDGPTNAPGAVSIVSWSDTQITAQLPTLAAGHWRLSVRSAAGVSGTNGLQILQRGPNDSTRGANRFNPILFLVNAPAGFAETSNGSTVRRDRTFATDPANLDNDHAVQNAINAAAQSDAAGRMAMVLVWPAPVRANNPTGDIFENLVLPRQLVLQGVGPGGFLPDNGGYVAGSRLNGLGFNPDTDRGAAWVTLVSGLPGVAGPDTIPDSAVVTVLQSGGSNSNRATAIDGFTITGGSQADFATAVDATLGGTTTPIGAPNALVSQGGGIYVHGGTQRLQITDNVIVGNSGSYGGAVRVGTPYATDAQNNDLRIAYNQIRDNGGTNLAGGIGLFANTRRYSVDHNDLCGNFSAEYGGAIGHFGRTSSSTGETANIDHNRIWFNQSYDEGGAVMVAGELSSSLSQPSTGSGRVSIHENLIQANLANDDGGGLRFLQAGTYQIDVVNNIIANNISAHEGGGIALDDAVNVRVVNNTVYRNVTTATAVTSNGEPAPAGLSTAQNSDQLQARLSRSAPTFSRPTMFNNIFWDNRAGTYNGQYVTGIGSPDAPAGDTIHNWDMGNADGGGLLEPTTTVLQTGTGTLASPTNKLNVDPLVMSPFEATVTVQASRTFPSFRQALIVVQDLPPALMGNYHLTGGSPAQNMGAASKASFFAPTTANAPTADYDGDARPFPTGTLRDAGADER